MIFFHVFNLSICHLKSLYLCFFVVAHFWFLVYAVFLLVLTLPLPLIDAVINLSLLCLLYLLSPWNDVSTQSSMIVNHISPSFLDSYSLSKSSPGCRASVSLGSSLVHFKNAPEYLRGLFLWLDFCCRVWFWNVFLFFWGTLFLLLYLYLVNVVRFKYFQVLVILFFFKCSDAFLVG